MSRSNVGRLASQRVKLATALTAVGPGPEVPSNSKQGGANPGRLGSRLRAWVPRSALKACGALPSCGWFGGAAGSCRYAKARPVRLRNACRRCGEASAATSAARLATSHFASCAPFDKPKQLRAHAPASARNRLSVGSNLYPARARAKRSNFRTQRTRFGWCLSSAKRNVSICWRHLHVGADRAPGWSVQDVDSCDRSGSPMAQCRSWLPCLASTAASITRQRAPAEADCLVGGSRRRKTRGPSGRSPPRHGILTALGSKSGSG